VKSCAGERPDVVTVEERGVVGDRLWAVLDPDGKLGSGKSSRRFRRMDGLQRLRARYDGELPVITFPDGTEARAGDEQIHALLTAYVGRPVTLGQEHQVSHFDEGPLHLVSTATLAGIGEDPGGDVGAVDARRLRPNLVVDLTDGAGNEESWSGRRVALGDSVVIEVLYAMPRCVMLDHEQVDLAPAPGLLKTVTDRRDGNAGIVADVVRGGTVRIGDEVRLDG
jgi:uncharacterized protein YcbX